MHEPKPLAGHRGLVLEALYPLADDVRSTVQAAGAAVEGPYVYGHVEQAKAALRSTEFDLAVLDISLQGGWSFPIVEELDRHGVGYVFLTRHGAGAIPPKWRHVPWCGKPCDDRELVAALVSVVRTQAQ